MTGLLTAFATIEEELEALHSTDDIETRITETLKRLYPDSTPEFYQLYTDILSDIHIGIEFSAFTLSFTGAPLEPDTITITVTPHYGS